MADEKVGRPPAAAARGVIRSAEDAELEQHFRELSPPERAREYFYDSNSGLPNERGWAVLRDSPVGPQDLVAHYSIEGVAWVNDTWGHDAGQLLYRAAAEALNRVDSRVAKVGGDFAGRVESEADAALFARMATRKLAAEYQGLTITAAVGRTLEEAAHNHHAEKARLEEAGLRSQRKSRPMGLVAGWAPKEAAHWGPPTAARPVPGRVERPVNGELLQAYGALEQGRAARDAYRDPMTGLLSPTGMGVLEQRGDHHLAIDIDGLRATDLYSSPLGDAVLRRVGAVMAAHQEELGVSFHVAHPHGDEFAAAHPQARALDRFAAGVRDELARAVVTYVDRDSGKVLTQTGIGFSYGVGPTRDAAEAALKLDKAERTRLGERDVSGERRLAEKRLSSRKATAVEIESAEAVVVEALRPPSRVRKVALAPGGPVVSRISRVSRQHEPQRQGDRFRGAARDVALDLDRDRDIER